MTNGGVLLVMTPTIIKAAVLKFKTIIPILLIFFLVSCVATLKTIPADNKIINSAVNFDVPRNMARLYLINGNCDVMFRNMKCIATNSIFLNKKFIGGLNERDRT